MKLETYHALLNEGLLDQGNHPHNHAEVKVPPKQFLADEVTQLAKELQEADPEWIYKAIPFPEMEGYFMIEAYEKDGTFIGRF